MAWLRALGAFLVLALACACETAQQSEPLALSAVVDRGVQRYVT
jgi:hypothetical protein